MDASPERALPPSAEAGPSQPRAPPEGPGGQGGKRAYSHITKTEDIVHYVLLAEFDIDQGATLSYQYPYPTGTDEHLLAELMLPDGAHLRDKDWTIFYLGQSAQSAVAPILSHEEGESSPDKRASASSNPDDENRPKRGSPGGGLLYVLNCVQCKTDKTVRRGALVKALAVATHYPFIQVFKPLLLLGLEQYIANPSPEVLAKIYDSCNNMNLIGMPLFTKPEKLILRGNDRQDLFEADFEMGREVARAAGVRAAAMESLEDDSESGSLASRGEGRGSAMMRNGSSASGRPAPSDSGSKKKGPTDNHFFQTEAVFDKYEIPIRIPVALSDEDIGEYSVVKLIMAFHNHPPFPAPFVPYLHTNGANTPAIILIINAILAHRKVIFLSSASADTVSQMVLAACSLASGGGSILRGITDTAFPYANLSSVDMLEELSGYVVGTANPRFEALVGLWDVICNIDTGRITVGKNAGLAPEPDMQGSLRESKSSMTSDHSMVRVDEDVGGTTPLKGSVTAKADSVDVAFMDEIMAAINSHYGEGHIRLRFAEWLNRFTRLAAAQEYTSTGTTKIGYPYIPYKSGSLGSGAVFADDVIRQREMVAHGHRIDAWRRTKSYKVFAKDWAAEMKKREVPFDIQHQVKRLRLAKKLSDEEAETIFTALSKISRYEEVIELLANCPPHQGGVMPLANGLLHRWPGVRLAAVDLLYTLQQFEIGRQAVASMNYFYRKTYLQLLEQRPPQHSEFSPTNGADGEGGWESSQTTPSQLIAA